MEKLSELHKDLRYLHTQCSFLETQPRIPSSYLLVKSFNHSLSSSLPTSQTNRHCTWFSIRLKFWSFLIPYKMHNQISCPKFTHRSIFLYPCASEPTTRGLKCGRRLFFPNDPWDVWFTVSAIHGEQFLRSWTEESPGQQSTGKRCRESLGHLVKACLNPVCAQSHLHFII